MMIDASSKWIRGKNFKLNNGRELKNLSLDFISEIEESSYQLFIRALCQNTEDMAVELYQIDLDYEDYTNYELFVMIMATYYFDDINRDEDFVSVLNEYLMIEEDLEVFVNEVKEVMFIDSITNKAIITKETYEEIRNITKKVVGFISIKLEKTDNEGTKKAYLESMLEDLEIAQEDNKEGKRISFASYITSIILESSYDYETVFNMNMFQFHTMTDMIKKREEWGNVMIGVYTGNIDVKKTKLGNSHWLLR